jgi:hypothetical protein
MARWIILAGFAALGLLGCDQPSSHGVRSAGVPGYADQKTAFDMQQQQAQLQFKETVGAETTATDTKTGDVLDELDL